MGQVAQLTIPEEVLVWCAAQQQAAGTNPAATLGLISQEVGQLVRHCLIVLHCPPADDDVRFGVYAQRLWGCIHFHWQRQAESGPVALTRVITHLQQGGAGPAAAGVDLLRDVALAQALELHEPQAAEIFEQEFLPAVKSMASKVGGAQGQDLVENFAADLVLPRAGRPPRIAQYRGQTSLAAWLRVVVVNHCRSAFRQRNVQGLCDESLLPDSRAGAGPTADHQPCRELLKPLIAQSMQAIDMEDRLLIQMLVVDETPQIQVARLLGVHSGNITRRRQKVTQQIWGGLQTAARMRGKERMATDCLELVLTEGHQELQQELGTLLAESLQQSSARKEAGLE